MTSKRYCFGERKRPFTQVEGMSPARHDVSEEIFELMVLEKINQNCIFYMSLGSNNLLCKDGSQ
jgi:hypothetical protein